MARPGLQPRFLKSQSFRFFFPADLVFLYAFEKKIKTTEKGITLISTEEKRTVDPGGRAKPGGMVSSRPLPLLTPSSDALCPGAPSRDTHHCSAGWRPCPADILRPGRGGDLMESACALCLERGLGTKQILTRALENSGQVYSRQPAEGQERVPALGLHGETNGKDRKAHRTEEV